MYMHQDGSCVCTSLRKASRAVTRQYDEALAEFGLTIVQFALLRNIGRSGPIALSSLAELMVMDRTSLYRALAALDRAGWIEIEGTGQGRAKAVSLTRSGRDVMADATPAWDVAQGRMIERFGADRWAILRGALTDMAALAQEDAR